MVNAIGPPAKIRHQNCPTGTARPQPKIFSATLARIFLCLPMEAVLASAIMRQLLDSEIGKPGPQTVGPLDAAKSHASGEDFGAKHTKPIKPFDFSDLSRRRKEAR